MLLELLLLSLVAGSQGEGVGHLTTDDQGFLNVIQGFASQLQCVVTDTCSDKVLWYKDDILLYSGLEFQTNSGIDEAGFVLNHNVDIDDKRGCKDECKTSADCEEGHSCVDSQCCACKREDYSLILRNLTFEDSGRYRCQIQNTSEQLEFQVEVLESGLNGGFHENISYDHSQCCEDKGISNMCKAMCKPSDMGSYHFDPTSCKTDDYKHFLSCATDGGKRSHVHCCKAQMVPSFCYDFCSGDFQMLRRSHRLCLYYLPEIFECYNRAYLPYPDPPEEIIVNAVEHDKLSVCWQPPKVQPTNKDFPVKNYTIFYKQLPAISFLPGLDGAAIDLPFMSGDYGELTDIIDDDYDIKETDESTRTSGKPQLTKRDTTKIQTEDRITLSVSKSGQIRKRRSMSASETEISFDPSKKAFAKRQTVVMVSRNENSNTTSVREFTYEEATTNGTCYTLTNLRSATRYAIYVIATNDYGQSVPSTRSLTSTNVHVISNNGSLPNSQKCCKDAKVDDHCASKMCDPTHHINIFETISISTSCRHEWPKVSPCIADGRNHTECCVRLGVQKECLPVCSGTTEELSMDSMLCLSLDLDTIYQCMREGYETHPSPPVNVTIDRITTNSARIHWKEPLANKHLVENYTIILRRNVHGADIIQISDAKSPYNLEGLEADASYAVSVRSHSEKGQSLPSTTLLFQTLTPNQDICPIGEPLMLNDGRPVLCHEKSHPCPIGYMCYEFLDDGYCCPEADPTSNQFNSCCELRDMKGDCLDACRYNATRLPTTCGKDLNTWVQCGSEGHDHTRCCEESSLPAECLPGCRHPFQVPETCMKYSAQLMYCYASHRSRLPGLVRNLHTTFVNETQATITWDVAGNADTYEVQFFNDNEHRLLNRTNVTATTITFPNLNTSTQYVARVIAFNTAGSSPPSWNLTLATDNENSAPLEPAAPSNLRIVWNNGAKINLTWNAVTTHKDGSPLSGKGEYTVSLVNAEAGTEWATKKTNNTWAVLDLVEDRRYMVYVTATFPKLEVNTSPSSSILTILAQQDSMGLPEPKTKVMPDTTVYKIEQDITVECSLENEYKGQNLTLEITAGNQQKRNDKGMLFVSMNLKVTKELDTIACMVSDSEGRQNVQMRNILVMFGPIAQMDRGIVHAFDDMSAKISCTVSGFPIPAVHFEKDNLIVGHGSGEHISIRNPALHTYQYNLILKNATAAGPGQYHCIAERNGTTSQAVAELITEKPSDLPQNPRKIFNCCVDKQVTGDCLEVCSIGKVPSNTSCLGHEKSLLACAEDVTDHSDCCIRSGVKGRCLSLCSGDSVSDEVDCTKYATRIMSCFVKSHERSPQQPTNVIYKVVDEGKVRISWNDPSAANNLVFYAVYYKKAGDDGDFEVVKTTSNSVDLDVEPGAEYEVGVISGNAFGHSPIAYLKMDDTAYSKPGGGLSSFALILILLFCCGGVVIVLIFIGRGSSLVPALFKKPRYTGNDPTVAFENPAYSNEVEIRGLGRSSDADLEWHSHELQPTASTGETTEGRNGMRYSKLDA
ncbi:unnamed protein product, partial [Mesorhabditis spiculigera]